MLTERERELASLVAQGLADKQIALKLGVNAQTVKNVLSGIYQRENINNRTQLAILWLRQNTVN